jgi:hypothetical protein
MQKPKRNADCHPDKPHRAKGLCLHCYENQRRREKRSPGEVKVNPKRATCHPEKPHYAHGMCSTCYARHWATLCPHGTKKDAEWRKKNRALILARSAASDRKRRGTSEGKKANNEKARRHHLKKFGMCEASYQQLLRKQDGLFPICRMPLKDVYKPGIDHNHETGEVRGGRRISDQQLNCSA